MEPETELPRADMPGPRASAEIAGNFMDCMPHKMKARRMGRAGLVVSADTVQNVPAGMDRRLRAPAAAVSAVLVKARMLHVNETSFRLDGRTIWVWIFLDPETGRCCTSCAPAWGATCCARCCPSSKE